MTNKELDALIDKLRDGDCCSEMSCNCDASADAITTLHAQLAEAQAEITATNAGWEKTSIVLAGANARADRAEQRVATLEAALAAQIDADAALCDDSMKALQAIDAAKGEILVAHALGLRIRNQPHDRTALDRVIAQTREKALREAAQVLDDEIDLARIAMPQVIPILAADRKAILAVIK